MTDNKQQKLTPTQEKAAQMLADGCKIKEITKALNVNRGTVWNWSRQALFIAETNRIRNEYRDSCRSIILGLLEEAGETLRRCLNSEADSVALKAALTVIEKVGSYKKKETDPENIEKEQHHAKMMQELKYL